MVTLARNLYFVRSRFLTDLTAVFLARRRRALARQVRTLFWCSRHHHGSPFPGSNFPFTTDVGVLQLWELPSRARAAHELQLAGVARAAHEEQLRP